MAAWQFDSFILPELKDLSYKKSLILPRSRKVESSIWNKFSNTKELIGFFGEILPLGKTWHENLTVYGELDKTCVNIWQEKGKIASVEFRYSLIDLDKSILQQLFEWMKKFKLILITCDSLQIIHSSDKLKYIQEIKKSSAWRFVENPQAFLENPPEDEGYEKL